jgi:hypothetical protein
MSKHKVSAEKPADPVICRSKTAAVDAFTNAESSDRLHTVPVTIADRETLTWYVFARGPVSARDAVLNVGHAVRVPDAELWGWVRDELSSLKRQAQDSLEGGTGVPEGASDE